MMVALSRQQILNRLAEQRDELKRLSVRRLSLFGSAAHDELREDSDLDFLVEFDQKTFHNYMDLKFFLEDSFERKVDLVIPTTIKPALKQYILKDVVDVPGLE